MQISVDKLCYISICKSELLGPFELWQNDHIFLFIYLFIFFAECLSIPKETDFSAQCSSTVHPAEHWDNIATALHGQEMRDACM